MNQFCPGFLLMFTLACSATCDAQPDKVYTSLEEALLNKENVYQLDLGGVNRPSEYESIAQLTNLQVLDLSFNPITDVPLPVCRLKNLRYLKLWGADLESLTDSLANLTNLEFLSLSWNALKDFPQVVCKLPNLKQLEISGNFISTLPECLFDMKQLQSLDLSFNRFAALPDSLGKMSGLRFLDISYNNISTLPPTIAMLTGLETFIVKKNELDSLPDEIGSMTGLTKLDLSECTLTSIPLTMKNLVGLVVLDLSQNHFYPWFTSFIIIRPGDPDVEICYGEHDFMYACYKDNLPVFFDSLKVISLDQAKTIALTRNLRTTEATLDFSGNGNPEWKLQDYPEMGKAIGCCSGEQLWNVLILDAVTGAVLGIENHKRVVDYGPDPLEPCTGHRRRFFSRR